MKTYTVEIEQPNGRVEVFSGVCMCGRQSARKHRRQGRWVKRLGPGVFIWYKSAWGRGQGPSGGVYAEVDDTNRAELAYTPETSFGGFASWSPPGAQAEFVLPKDRAEELRNLDVKARRAWLTGEWD